MATFAPFCTAWRSHMHSLQNYFIFTKRRDVQIWKNGQQFAALKGSETVWADFDAMPCA